MTGVDPASFGDDFERRLLATISDTGVSPDRVHVCPSGLTVVPDEHGRFLSYLGCPACLGLPKDQDEKGEPLVGNRKLLRAADLGIIPPGVGPEVSANLWVCGACRLPVQTYLPTFD